MPAILDDRDRTDRRAVRCGRVSTWKPGGAHLGHHVL